MFTRRIGGGFSKLVIVFTVIAGLAACGDAPLLVVKNLAAQPAEIGAPQPPLPPIESRAPQFNQVFAEVADKVVPTVVSIHSAKVEQVPFNPFEWFFGNPGDEQNQRQTPAPSERRIEGVGSGVIVSSDGYILTNNHVVEGSDDLTVTLWDNREFTAKIVGTDPPTDIAVIKIDGVDNLPVAHLGDSDKLRIGEMVLAVGSPFQLSETVTMGIISALGRNTTYINEYENFIQTDAAINPGNSGGPLVNMNGSVVGINSAIYSRVGANAGVGFAIPINMAKQIIHTLLTEGHVSRGYLGVGIDDIDQDVAKSLKVEPNSGAMVVSVQEGTPAEKAGLAPYDIITNVNGERVKNAQELRNKVAMIKPGSKASFTVLRDGKEKNYTVTLVDREENIAKAGGLAPGESSSTKTGLTLHNITPDFAQRFDLKEKQIGVLIIAVDPTGPGARARLREGDVILEANRQKVEGVADFNRILSSAESDTILLRVQRAGGVFLAALKLVK